MKRPPTLLLLQMQPLTATTMFWKDLLPLSRLLVLSVSFILLCSSPTATSPTSVWISPRITASVEEARQWMDATYSREKQKEWDVCQASPYLTYLRSHLRSFLRVDYPANAPENTSLVSHSSTPSTCRTSSSPTAPTWPKCPLPQTHSATSATVSWAATTPRTGTIANGFRTL
jgi:hypothetical protein